MTKILSGYNKENGLLIDNQSGEIAKLSNKPSFMQIVK